MALTRRDFFRMFRGASPPPRPSATVVVTAEVQARAGAFREQLTTRARSTPPESPRYAVLTPHLCLLRLGTECATCAEVCPEPGALEVRGRKVEVDASRCTGCGRCAERCPAPIPALAMRPVSP